MRNATPTMLVTLALLGLAGAAPAEEMLPNGKFDGNVADWTACCGASGTFGFDATRDASGSDLSGSAELAHTQITQTAQGRHRRRRLQRRLGHRRREDVRRRRRGALSASPARGPACAGRRARRPVRGRHRSTSVVKPP
ncbi:MAG: hypothetical protein AB1689_13230 [Thermodesulfobacteriota bacterium]